MTRDQLDFDNQPQGSPASGSSPPRRAAVEDMEPGQQVQETYLASSKEMRTTKQGKPFLKLKLSDRTGTVDGVLWDDAEEAARLFEQGDHIQVSGQISEYAGSAQVKINNIQPVSPTQVDPHDFLPSTYRDIEELQGYLRFHMESVHDRDYRRLLDHVFNDSEFLERFTRAPAATRYHHAYLGGLLEHTVSVTSLCDHVAQQYPRVNRDLVITAAILHDLGKVDELNYEQAIEYSDAGKFLGHVTIGAIFISEKISAISGFPKEKADQLLHTLVSHHGELEWGSPKRPKTLEALIIHHIDNLDAKVKGFLEIVEGSRNAEWTDLRNLFRRPLHIPRAAHQEEDLIPPVRPEDSEESGPEENGPEERG